MEEENLDSNLKTWSVKVRPIGNPNSPWEEHRLKARSAAHADLMARKMGYEMQTGTALLSSESWSSLTPDKPLTITCTQCGYSLDGLTVNESRIQCPECNHDQLVIPWTPGVALGEVAQGSVLLWIFASIGMIATVILVFVVLFAAVGPF
jgi:DNA-directed RNA polymerase subunit RPC12/RpoP